MSQKSNNYQTSSKSPGVGRKKIKIYCLIDTKPIRVEKTNLNAQFVFMQRGKDDCRAHETILIFLLQIKDLRDK